MASIASGLRTHKSCDACTSRKVRCSGSPGPCNNCQRRKTECIFGVRKLGRKANVMKKFMAMNNVPETAGNPNASSQNCTVSVLDFAASPCPRPGQSTASDTDPTPPSTSSEAGRPVPYRIPDLYVDRVLERADESCRSPKGRAASPKFIKVSGVLNGGQNSLSFFSEHRLKSLSLRLGHDRVRDLVGRVSADINRHLRTATRFSSNISSHQGSRTPPSCLQDKSRVAKWIKLYFECVHPRLPFLDQAAFEATAASQNQPNVVPRSKSWTALYHTILAFGSQYDGGGSFEPEKGESWELFSVALANFTDLMLLPDSLTTLQALTAMAIYTLGVSSFGLDQVIMSEAVRRAQNLADAKFNGHATNAYRKTFWVLYSLEKLITFQLGKTSLFNDSHISCPIPPAPESSYGGFNWFVALIRHARLLSRASTYLFSVGASGNSDEYYLDVIDQLNEELEGWRASLPDNGFKPGGLIKPSEIASSILAQEIAVIMHFCYHNFLQTISRMILRYLPSSHVSRREAAFDTVEKSSQSLLELTSLIHIAPYTPSWMVIGIPMVGFFVLFDIVIHNPRQRQAISHLALLDAAADYYDRLEYMSNGLIPGSLMREFAQIARVYVNEVNGQSPSPQQLCSNASQALFTQPYWSLPHEDIQNITAMDMTADLSEMNLTGESGTPGKADPMDIEGLPIQPNVIMGTELMNLFGYWHSDMDPFFYHAMDGNNNLFQTGLQSDEHLAPDHHGGV
ncbi:fungal specific transcription factor domain containing protein [Colletotrichum truncatum]|uniref:Fungal specific transcription factor domain containing protein n=1 Tax=Colletotrichum truncatum TaxID=5467 RepID=A0ACC3Z8Y3_COLTU